MKGVNQVQAKRQAGGDLRRRAAIGFLRQGIRTFIMVGEIRDLETAEIAIKRCPDRFTPCYFRRYIQTTAPQSIARLANMGVPTYNIVLPFHMVLAHAWEGKPLHKCKKIEEVPNEALRKIGFTGGRWIEDWGGGLKFIRPMAVISAMPGFKGRSGVFPQVMPITTRPWKRIILKGPAAPRRDLFGVGGFSRSDYFST